MGTTMTTVLVDSNIFIQLLYEGPRAEEAEELLVQHPLLATSLGIVDEVLHFIIRREARIKYGITKSYELRKLVRRTGIQFAKEQIEKFLSMINELYIRVLADIVSSPQQIVNVMENYNLPPRDAIIALTCKHYGINIILTFDKDFKKIPWLKVIP